MMMSVLVLAATASVILTFTYTIGMYLEGRSRVDVPDRPSGGLLFVYLIPCLDEERVIGKTLDRLTAGAGPDSLVIVVDDGSKDATADVVRARADERILLLQRRLPEARQGKGAALNAAIEHLVVHPELLGRATSDVVICLLDADGRLDVQTPDVVGPYFRDPAVGAVQVAVRIGNRADGVLPRLQDMEFVCYTEVFQRCRSLGGFAGLGGNGQFTRLSALLSLGRRPWANTVLTEDLDLGVRLVLAGWRTVYTRDVAVQQQGLTTMRGLVRQRSRWFQGLLQCWRLLPRVAEQATGRARLDLLHMLLSPVLIFAAFLMTLSFLTAPVEWLITSAPDGAQFELRGGVAWYTLTFAPAVLFAAAYRGVSGVGRIRSFALGHVFVLYGLLWVAAGSSALGRMLFRRQGWLKTDRLLEGSGSADDVGAVPGSVGAQQASEAPHHFPAGPA
jgi:1,2-diacylglycerol 3-beta-glucosyltransferase